MSTSYEWNKSVEKIENNFKTSLNNITEGNILIDYNNNDNNLTFEEFRQREINKRHKEEKLEKIKKEEKESKLILNIIIMLLIIGLGLIILGYFHLIH